MPLDYSIYATELAAYLDDLKKVAPADFSAAELQPLIEKCHTWHDAAARVRSRMDPTFGHRGVGEHLHGAPEGGRAMKALPYQGEGLHASEVNAALMAQERALLDTDGIPGRPWFRHLVYAPLPTYEAETLPGLREALVEKDMERAKAQAKEFGRALDRAIAALGRVQ